MDRGFNNMDEKADMVVIPPFTFKDAMKLLKVSRSTLYRLMWHGVLTGYKVGSTWRFHGEDLAKAAIQTEAPKPPCLA